MTTPSTPSKVAQAGGVTESPEVVRMPAKPSFAAAIQANNAASAAKKSPELVSPNTLKFGSVGVNLPARTQSAPPAEAEEPPKPVPVVAPQPVHQEPAPFVGFNPAFGYQNPYYRHYRPYYMPQPSAPYYPPQPAAAAAPVAPLQPQRRKLTIIDPDTGKEIDLGGSKAVKIERPEDHVKPVVVEAPKPVVPEVVRKSAAIPIVNPENLQPLDLSDLVNKLSISVEQPSPTQDDDMFSEAAVLSEEDSHSGDDDEEEDEDLDDGTPRLLKRGEAVLYPRMAIGFEPPAAGSDSAWQYSRAFLLQFRRHCLGKPDDVPDQLIRVRRHQEERAAERSRRGGSGRDRGHGRGHRAGSSGGPQLTTAALTNRAENSWQRANSCLLPAEEQKLREVKGLLNKLTMEKFDLLSQKILDLDILHASLMPSVIDMVFDKAVEEPGFAHMYARLARRIVDAEVKEERERHAESQGEGEAKVDSKFRRFIVTKCQIEFEKKQAWSTQRLERLHAQKQQQQQKDGKEQQPVEQEVPETSATPVNSGELTEEDYLLIKLKRRVLGNMRFIGELYRVGLIAEKIMHGVIRNLLENYLEPEEEEIESCCKLLNTIGPLLDTPASASQMQSYVQRMVYLTTSEDLSKRVRFAVLDVLDLRKSNWNKPGNAGHLMSLVVNVPQSKPTPSPAPQVKTRATGDVRLEQPQSRPASAASSSRPRSTSTGASSGAAPVRYSTAARPSTPKDGFEVVSNANGNRRPTPVNPANRRSSPFAGAKPVNTRPPQAPAPAPSPASGRFGALAAEESPKEMPHHGWPAEETKDVQEEVKGESVEASEDVDAGKLIAVFDEYLSQHNLSDVLDEIKSEALLMALINHALDQRKSAQALVPVLEAVKNLNRERCLQTTLANLSEMSVDLPVVYEHAGIVLVPWLKQIGFIFPQMNTHASRAVHWALSHVAGQVAKLEIIQNLSLPAIGLHGGDRLAEIKALVALAPTHAKLLKLQKADSFASEAKEILISNPDVLGNSQVAWSLTWNLIRLIGPMAEQQQQRVKEEILPQLIPCLAMITATGDWKDSIQKALKESSLSDSDRQVLSEGLKDLGI